MSALFPGNCEEERIAMNRLTLRVLSGAVCTVGFLALGMGVAHAEDSSTSQAPGLLGVKVDLDLGSTHHNKATHSKTKPVVKVDLGAKVAKVTQGARVTKVAAKVSTPLTRHHTTPRRRRRHRPRRRR